LSARIIVHRVAFATVIRAQASNGRSKLFKAAHLNPIPDELESRAAPILELPKVELLAKASCPTEDQFRELTEAVNEVFWTWNVATEEISYVSPAYERMWGRTCQSLRDRPRSFIDAVVPDDREKLIAALSGMAVSGEMNLEYRISQPHGAIRWIWHRAFPVKGDRGELLRVVVMAQDVTTRKQLKTDLAHSEEQLAEAQALTHLGHWDWDIVSGELVWSDEIYRIFGLERESFEPTNTSFFDLIHPDDEPRVHVTLDASLAAGLPFELEFRIVRPDGEQRVLYSRGVVIRNSTDQPVRMFGIAQDITEQRMAVEKLTESEVRFSTVFRASPIAFGIGRLSDGQFIDVNEAFLTLYGYARQEVIGHTALELNLWPTGEDRARFIATLQEHGRVQQVDVKFRRSSGKLVDIQISAELIRLDGQKYMLAMLQDVSERKRLEERLRHTLKMEGIGHLAVGMAHEFNNILSAMMMNLGLLQSKPLDAEGAESLSDMNSLFARAADLVRQLLAFGRKSPMHTQSVDLRQIVNGFSNTLRSVVEDHIIVEFKAPAELSRVQADKDKIDEVLMNVCLNARDAMPQGGRLTLELEECLLTAEHARAHQDARAGRFVSLSVRDTGCGISEPARRRLFEPFFTTKSVGKGTGLGLAAVHGIILQHHGWIEVESQIGRGTTFRILLPSETETTSEARIPASPEPKRCGSEIILLVDDEAGLRKLLCRLLRKSGYTVLEACNATEALELWGSQQEEIDLLFTDMTMPGGMNGLEMCRKMRQDKPGLNVIISSGYTTELGIHRDSTGSDIVYLPKPCAPGVVISTVQTCLSNK
jgi:PAS domain S-box-containing protein